MNLTLKTGRKAYFDTFAGMIPCTVLSISGSSGPASSSQTVQIKVTKTIQAYREGEIIKSSALHICPVKAFYYRNGVGRIKPYQVETDKPRA